METSKVLSSKLAAVVLSLCVLFSFAPVANAQDLLPEDNGIFTYHEPLRYRDSEGHPLRVAAYLTHWSGWIVREVLIRPFSYMAGSTEFTRSFFGYREPLDYRQPICFDPANAFPDCRAISPYNGITSANVPMINEDVGGAEEVTLDSSDSASSRVVSERQVYMPDVAFEYDNARLNALGRGRVRQVAQLLSAVPDLSVVVQGHADSRGGDEYNANLGQRRSESVIAELVELGIDPARLSPQSYGETQPIFADNEDWAWAVNRRVQFGVSGE